LLRAYGPLVLSVFDVVAARLILGFAIGENRSLYDIYVYVFCVGFYLSNSFRHNEYKVCSV